jgi:formamidopyrimidine-DNA glycosylase
VPELPEVETIKNDLAPQMAGRTLRQVVLYWPGVVQEPSPQQLAERLPGQRVVTLSRRGKYLLLGLLSGESLIFHLMMTGRLLLRHLSHPPDPHTRVAFLLDGDLELRFADTRKFGRIWLTREPQRVLGKLGPEPLDSAFGVAELAERLKGRSGRIKPLLLDQSFLAGVGNIYADESLFLARIHPLRKASSLSPKEVEGLYRALRIVLQRAIKNRGTSFDDYRDGFGEMGRNQLELSIFQRGGESCPRCGATVQRIVVGGRGTHLCPHCQAL